MTGDMRVDKLLLPLLLLITACSKGDDPAAEDIGVVTLEFTNTVKNTPLILNGPTYTNSLGEAYTLRKFKYYISNITLNNATVSDAEKESYHLIDQANTASLSFNLLPKVNNYTSISFLLGVDSLRNVSGAQSGALDPLNDMFWTWSTGYIMAKVEGSSPVSNQPNNRIEYHIGGFSGPNSVLKKITLPFPSGKVLDIRKGQICRLKITADLDTWWQGPNTISLAALPVCTTPGAQSKAVADNYAKMFTITEVIN
jgi:hypothetical protein